MSISLLESNTLFGLGDTAKFISDWGENKKGESFVISGLFYSGYYLSVIICGSCSIEAVPWVIKIIKKSKKINKQKNALRWTIYLQDNFIVPIAAFCDTNKLVKKYLKNTKYCK
jgi:hypothetical protein